MSGCSAAAASIMLPDTSAKLDEHPHGVMFDPPFCYYEDGTLKFNAGRNSGYCSSSDQCLCAGPTLQPDAYPGKYTQSAGINDAHWDEEDWHWVTEVPRPPGILRIFVISTRCVKRGGHRIMHEPHHNL